MTIQSAWKRLESSRVFSRIPIVSSLVRDLFSSLNALYEATFDAEALESGTQVHIGHDHADEGGGPLICGSQFTADNGGATLNLSGVFAPGDVKAHFVGPCYVSPGLSNSSKLLYAEIKICYRANGGDFLIWMDGDKEHAVQVKATGTGELTTAWETLRLPLLRSKAWVWPVLNMECLRSDDGADTANFYAFSLNICETYEGSAPQAHGLLGSREIQRGITGQYTILRYFEAMDSEMAIALQWFDAYVTKTIFSAINFFYEAIMDLAAPGAASQYIQGHDHYSLGQGGRDIPRGKIFSTIHDPEYGWLHATCTVAAAYYYADHSNTHRRTNSGPQYFINTASANPIFRAWVSDGLTSVGASPPYTIHLIAKVYNRIVGSHGGAGVVIRNQTTGKNSAGAVYSADGWLEVDDIPCLGGAWNDFDIQVWTQNGGCEVYIDGIVLVEACKVDDAVVTYVPSSGTRILGNVRSGEEYADT